MVDRRNRTQQGHSMPAVTDLPSREDVQQAVSGNIGEANSPQRIQSVIADLYASGVLMTRAEFIASEGLDGEPLYRVDVKGKYFNDESKARAKMWPAGWVRKGVLIQVWPKEDTG